MDRPSARIQCSNTCRSNDGEGLVDRFQDELDERGFPGAGLPCQEKARVRPRYQVVGVLHRTIVRIDGVWL